MSDTTSTAATTADTATTQAGAAGATAGTDAASLLTAAAGADTASTQADAAAADKAADTTKAVPDDYAFAAPDGADGKPMEMDADALTAFKGVAKEHGLSQEAFQAVMAFGADRLAKLANGPADTYRELQSTWSNEVKNDPDIGGAKLPATLADAARSIDHFGAMLPEKDGVGGAQQIRQMLEFTGVGNNPVAVRLFAAMGRSLGDATGVSLGKPAGSNAPASYEDKARAVYGKPPLVSA